MDNGSIARSRRVDGRGEWNADSGRGRFSWRDGSSNDPAQCRPSTGRLTTLIVSLGFITQVRHLFVIEAAVAALVLHAMVVNRLSGIDFPLWAPKRHPVLLPRPPRD